MFDRNQFKRIVKQWVKDNQQATIYDLIDYCEDQIPPADYTANSWLIDQTVNWYKHILANREYYTNEVESEDFFKMAN